MTVVSNTSPITNLAAVGARYSGFKSRSLLALRQLHLLQRLYNNIVIPGAVYQELTGFGANIPGATEVQTFDWIQVQTVSDKKSMLFYKENYSEANQKRSFLL